MDAVRAFRFYGRRHGRPLRCGRQDALATAFPRVAVDLPSTGTVDMSALFPADRPIWLEIGFGNGEHLIGQAQAHPEIGFVGCEAYVNGVAALLAGMERQAVDTIRVFDDDVRLLLDRLPDASVARVFVLFPDPWPKRRHHRRRLMQPAVVRRLADVLQPGGILQFATDSPEYARWTLAEVLSENRFSWPARRPRDWREPPDDWIGTRYERKARARGASCFYLRFQRSALAQT